MSRRRGIYLALFPRGVRLWHFILLPPLAMAIVLGAFRIVDHAVAPLLSGPDGHETYHAVRTVLIALTMASVVGFLALQYRSRFELEIQAHNEALEATRDFLTRIIEGTADAIIVRDADGRVTSWNPAAREIFGWTSEEMLGAKFERLVPAKDGSIPAIRGIDEALRDGRTLHNLETGGVRKNGDAITFALTVAPLYDANGNFAGTTGIARDVTAIKKLESQLLERERLAAVGELAAMVAHEVRNPLAGIRGGCEILLEGYASGDTRHDIGVEIIHQVDRLSRTVHDLLLFARPKAIDLVPTDLHGLIDRIFHLLGDDPENAAVVMLRDFGLDAPVVQVDGRQMEQVFLNLLLNAIQVMHRKGTLTVATRARAGGLVVTVSDTGPGIPDDQLARIFEPFFTTRSQGTGLGLAIVKKIVEAHGGRIEASSVPGSGASFAVTIPWEASA